MSRVVAAGAAASVPVVWDFLGFHFQAGPTVVAVCAVIITRLILNLNTHGHRRIVLDIAVTSLCALVAVLMVQSMTLGLFGAGMTAIGIAGMGLGVIEVIKRRMSGRLEAVLDALFGTTTPKP